MIERDDQSFDLDGVLLVFCVVLVATVDSARTTANSTTHSRSNTTHTSADHVSGVCGDPEHSIHAGSPVPGRVAARIGWVISCTSERPSWLRPRRANPGYIQTSRYILTW